MTDLLKPKGFFIPTSYRLYGDVVLSAPLKRTAQGLIQKMENAGLSAWRLRVMDADIHIQRLKGHNIVSITKVGGGGKKKIQEWTLLYAPCPRPDPQDWPGWIEANKTTLVAEQFNNEWAFMPWGDPIYGEMTPTVGPTEVSTYKDTLNCGYLSVGIEKYTSVGFYHDGSRTSQSHAVDFQGLFSASYANTSESFRVSAMWVDGAAGGGPPAIPDLTYNLTGGALYSSEYSELYVSWQGQSIGFPKWDLTAYNPSSYLDANNYIFFYDHYTQRNTDFYGDLAAFRWGTSMARPAVMYVPYWMSVYHYPGEPWATYYTKLSLETSCLTSKFIEEILTEYTSWVTIYDPYVPDPSDAAATSYATYETIMMGKINGVAFGERIAYATKIGSGAWIGTTAYPWMGRIYDKKYLKEVIDGAERISENNLLITSYLLGPATGYDSVFPGASNGITSTVYREMHGSVDVTKTYVVPGYASGWHDVYTDPNTGRTWRAYGDLFAALGTVKEEGITA